MDLCTGKIDTISCLSSLGHSRLNIVGHTVPGHVEFNLLNDVISQEEDRLTERHMAYLLINILYIVEAFSR